MFKKFKRAFTGHPGVEGIAGAPGPQGPQGPKGDTPTYRSPKFTAVNGDDTSAPPTRAHAGDAGYDLTLAGPELVLLAPGDRDTVPTGYSVRLDPSTCGLILPRSGNASKLGLNVITGVVDAGYDGELKVIVHNTSRNKIVLKPGMRVAQLVVMPVVNHDAAANTAERGAHGFGSTDTAVVETKAPAKDMVNHPPHYAAHPVFKRECHYYTKYMTFDQGNAFKYLWRCAAKGDMRENLDKAVWYLNAMLTGPVVGRYGNVLREELTNQLIMDMASAVVGVNSPPRYLAAIEVYWGCVHLAQGKPHKALTQINSALTILDGVN